MDDPGDSSLVKTSNKHEHSRPENPPNPNVAEDDAPTQEIVNIVDPSIGQQTGGDVLNAGGLEEGSQKKLRGRNEEHRSSSSATQKPKRKVELLETPERDPNCVVCGKNFNSWKALFGHMRSHPERQWRGVFPPPMGGWDPSVPVDREAEPGTGIVPDLAQEEIATALLNVAQGVLATMTSLVVATSNTDEGSKVDEASASASSPTRGLVIDLNQPQEKSSKALKFDLNLPPENDEDSPKPSSNGES